MLPRCQYRPWRRRIAGKPEPGTAWGLCEYRTWRREGGGWPGGQGTWRALSRRAEGITPAPYAISVPDTA
eukprot:3752220-Rhodomonas_salina.3